MPEPWTYLFQSERWAACDKPPGWLSVPSRMGRADPRPVLGLALETALGRRVWPVHRLDLEVSGLILFALDAEAHRCASRWFETHDVRKTYEAWTTVATPAPPDEQEWRCRLARGKKRAFEAPHGKDAVTLARALDLVTYGAHTLQRWRLQPLTGRSHQLRYELARHGHPIVGDALYGSELPFRPDAIALRSVQLDFRTCKEHAALGLPDTLEAVPLAVTSESR
jgi:tRNA pseudouridine32 synthase/23S rRNA pseudouridine746 synthase